MIIEKLCRPVKYIIIILFSPLKKTKAIKSKKLEFKKENLWIANAKK